MTNSENASNSLNSNTTQGNRRAINASGNSSEKAESTISNQPSIDTSKPTRWVQIRLIPIWLRIIIVLVLLFAAVCVGVTVGYGYVGSGDPGDALKGSTWKHLLDIMNGTE